MTINFSFNKIYILESLDESEIQTGKNIFNDLIRWKTNGNYSLYSEYFNINNKVDFDNSFLHIKSDIKRGFYPFIHFEMHGSKRKGGLILKSREQISWQELSKFTRDINITTKNNLIISLATCYGSNFINSIDINEVAPFSCCISTLEEITAEEVEVNFMSFFETILSTTDFNLAVDNLNKSNQEHNKYHFFSSEEFLEMILEKLINKDFKDYSITNKNWVNTITKKLRNISPEYAGLKKKKVKEIVRSTLKDKKSGLRKEFRKSFLSIS